jgi:hypothetical protein
MKKRIISSLIFSALLLIFSCESGSENSSSDGKVDIKINKPPSGDYYIGVSYGEFTRDNQPVFTTDFETYTQITNQFTNGISSLWLDNDTLVVAEFQDSETAKYSIFFASVDDLEHFTTVTSIYRVSYAAVINGGIVAYNEFNQIGTCLAGQTDITWQTKLPTGTGITGPFRVSRGAMIAPASINSSDGYAISTSKGLTWNFNIPNYGNGDIELIDGKSWSVSQESWGYITSNDFANGAWVTDSFNDFLEGNTTTQSGIFKTQSSKMLMFPNDWRIYGYIENDSNQTLYQYSAVNKSTDNGVTWTTSLLKDGFSEPDKVESRIFATSSLTILGYQENLMPQPEYYSSTDGVTFTKMSTDADFLNTLLNSTWTYVR